MESPKISVIVPVYKAENYLHKCVDSLLSQTFTDFEIILVDDGSPDRSGELCDSYAKKDSRIRVIHKENGGVSSARQCGMDNARGEYTIHADPDDWVERDMLEELYRKAKEDNADMVICDFYQMFPYKQVCTCQCPSSLDARNVLRDLFQRLHGSCCNKLVRRACYNKYEIKFPKKLNICEDFFVNAALLKHPIKVSYVNKAFYHYDRSVNPNSITRAMLPNHLAQDEKIIETVEALFPKKEYAVERSSQICNALFHIFEISNYSNKEFKDKYGQYKSTIKEAILIPTINRKMLSLSFAGYYRLVVYVYTYGYKNLIKIYHWLLTLKNKM